MAKDIYGLSLRDIMPPSIAGDPQIQAMMDALDPELQSVSFDTREALIYSRIDELPEDVIDLLAEQFHVDFYEPMELSLEVKRGLVKTSILVHKRKGTKWAVQELCNIVFGDTKVSPWFEYDGEPYHFKVSTEAHLPTADDWRKFFYALVVTKSERDWLDAIEIRRDKNLDIRYAHGSLSHGSVTIGHAVKDTKAEQNLVVAMGSQAGGRVEVRHAIKNDSANQSVVIGIGSRISGSVVIRHREEVI